MSIASGLSILWLLPTPCWACLNDSDSERMEAKSLPQLARVIVGDFDRFPPLYYESRLKRITPILNDDPSSRIALYDDAAVACDRLGRFDEAIAWMEKKRGQLEGQFPRKEANVEARYRYHANVGTHWVHRWLRAGADRTKIAEVETARRHIAEAIRLKPDAHFNRERYQLQAIEWIIAARPSRPDEPFPTFVREVDLDRDPGDVVEGLAGLIVLGNAWESVDAFHALALALKRLRRPIPAAEAAMRCSELIEQGRRSLVPDSPSGSALKTRMGLNDLIPDDTAVKLDFRDRRRLADAQQAERRAKIIARLETGSHPDTDSDFWSYDDGMSRTDLTEESIAGNLVPDSVKDEASHSALVAALLGIRRWSPLRWAEAGIEVILVGLLIGLGVRAWRRARRARAVVKPISEDVLLGP